MDGLGRLRVAAPRQDDLVRLGQGRVVRVVEQVDELGVIAAFVLGADHGQSGEYAGQHRQFGHRFGTVDERLESVLECAHTELAGVKFGDFQLRFFRERH